MTTSRTEYTAGLRALADLLDQHDDLPLPYHGRGTELCWIETAGADVQRERGSVERTPAPGNVRKEVRDVDFDLKGQIAGVRVQMILSRDAVCTRVVKEVREVTEEVPDPDALAAVPMVTVTRTVEDVEWVCEPLLAERTAVAS